jgi:acyl carrier protein
MDNRQIIIDLIYDSLKEVNADLKSTELEKPTPDTVLFGSTSALDSIALVNLIADLEEKIQDRFGKTIILADEKAMSRFHSPFRSVGALADSIIKKL